MENNSTKQGREGERKAKEYLQKKGYKILANNWRFSKYEIDLIALYKDILVFVEVKYRKNSDFGEPELFVDKKKQRNLIKAANEYIRQEDLDTEARFDIVSITDYKQQIIHLEGAFFPTV